MNTKQCLIILKVLKVAHEKFTWNGYKIPCIWASWGCHCGGGTTRRTPMMMVAILFVGAGASCCGSMWRRHHMMGMEIILVVAEASCRCHCCGGIWTRHHMMYLGLLLFAWCSTNFLCSSWSLCSLPQWSAVIVVLVVWHHKLLLMFCRCSLMMWAMAWREKRHQKHFGENKEGYRKCLGVPKKFGVVRNELRSHGN